MVNMFEYYNGKLTAVNFGLNYTHYNKLSLHLQNFLSKDIPDMCSVNCYYNEATNTYYVNIIMIKISSLIKDENQEPNYLEESILAAIKDKLENVLNIKTRKIPRTNLFEFKLSKKKAAEVLTLLAIYGYM